MSPSGGDRGSASHSQPPLASLPLWRSSKTLEDIFKKNFSPGEVFMQLRSASGPYAAADVPSFDLREDLAFLAKHSEPGSDTSLFQFQDPAQASAILVRVLSVRTLPSGAPLFDVEYLSATRARATESLPLVEYLLNLCGPPIRVAQLTASISEQDLLLAELEKNAGGGGYALGSPSRAGLKRSFLVEIARPEFSRKYNRQKICAVCKEPASKKCARCNSSHYCSKAHQREHWVSGHKRSCRNAEAARAKGFDVDTQSVVFSATNVSCDSTMPFGPGFTPSAVSYSTKNGKSYTNPAPLKTPVNVHGDDEFVVKAQLALIGPKSVVLYDETRSFYRTIDCSESCHDALEKKTRSTEYFGGTKLFFWAKREAGNFRVFLERLPPQEQNW